VHTFSKFAKQLPSITIRNQQDVFASTRTVDRLIATTGSCIEFNCQQLTGYFATDSYQHDKSTNPFSWLCSKKAKMYDIFSTEQ
jgi:hypothetical protein